MWPPIWAGTALFPGLNLRSGIQSSWNIHIFGASCPEVYDLHCPSSIKQRSPYLVLPISILLLYSFLLSTYQNLTYHVFHFVSLLMFFRWVCFLWDTDHKTELVMQEIYKGQNLGGKTEGSWGVWKVVRPWCHLALSKGKREGRKEGWNALDCCMDLRELGRAMVESLTKMSHESSTTPPWNGPTWVSQLYSVIGRNILTKSMASSVTKAVTDFRVQQL